MHRSAHTVEGGGLRGFDTCSIVLEKDAVQPDGSSLPTRMTGMVQSIFSSAARRVDVQVQRKVSTP